MVKLASKNGNYLIAAAQNRGPLKIFSLERNVNFIAVEPTDVSAEIKYSGGVSRKQELYYGYSFLSQSARTLCIDSNVISVTISDNKGGTRKVK